MKKKCSQFKRKLALCIRRFTNDTEQSAIWKRHLILIWNIPQVNETNFIAKCTCRPHNEINYNWISCFIIIWNTGHTMEQTTTALSYETPTTQWNKLQLHYHMKHQPHNGTNYNCTIIWDTGHTMEQTTTALSHETPTTQWNKLQLHYHMKHQQHNGTNYIQLHNTNAWNYLQLNCRWMKQRYEDLKFIIVIQKNN